MSDALSNDLASLRIQRQEPPPGPRRGLPWRWIAAIGSVVLLGGAGAAAWPFVEAQVFKTEVAVTRIALVSPVAASTTLSASGYVVPQSISKVASKIPGRVAKVHAREGDKVAKDQILMELDASDQQSQLAGSRSRMAAAQARAATAKANLAVVQQQLAREKALAAVGASARSTMEDLEAQLQALQAALEAAHADVKVAQSDEQAARVALEQMTIRSPIAGTVLHKPLEVGEVAGFTSSGVQQSLIDVADLSSDVVEADVPETRLYLVKVGTPAEISLDAFPGKRYRGEAYEFGRQVDRAKATLVVKVRFLDPKDGVLPDMSARVSFLAERPTDEQLRAAARVVVPAGALVERGGGKAVFTVDEDGGVHVTPIQVGEAVGDGFLVTSGPKPGTRVVDRPPATLQDGVKIKEKAAP